jgi:SRSO17 transposase
MIGSRNPVSFTPGRVRASPSNTQGGSRMPELGPSGSERGRAAMRVPTAICLLDESPSPGEYDQLHHFVAAGVWDMAPLAAELLAQADLLVGGEDAVLVIDDTALPKKGDHSVGVAAQYASALGKTANCQTLVSTTLARGEVPVMVGLRLFLTESWTSDPVRMAAAHIPTDQRLFRTKPELAIEEVDRIRAAGVRFGCVLADAGYGLSAPFRRALSERGLHWAVGIPRHQKVYPADVALICAVHRHHFNARTAKSTA